MTGRMFADQAVTLDLGFPTARDQFLLLTQGNRLDGMSRDAYADGLASQIITQRDIRPLRTEGKPVGYLYA